MVKAQMNIKPDAYVKQVSDAQKAERINIRANVHVKHVIDIKKAERLRALLSKVVSIRTAAVPVYRNGDVHGLNVKWWSEAEKINIRIKSEAAAQKIVDDFK